MEAYYEELWERLPETLSPPALELRAAFLLAHAADGQAILDLGCGDGAFAELLSEHLDGASLTLADVAAAALARARRRPRLDPGATFVQVGFDAPLPFEDNAFDLVWASEVIEHVADTARWLSEVRRVLRPGGTVALTTPNHPRWRLLVGGVGAVSPPLGDHLHLYDRRGLAGLLDDFGFDDVEVRAAGRIGPWSGQLLASARR